MPYDGLGCYYPKKTQIKSVPQGKLEMLVREKIMNSMAGIGPAPTGKKMKLGTNVIGSQFYGLIDYSTN